MQEVVEGSQLAKEDIRGLNRHGAEDAEEDEAANPEVVVQ